MKGLSLVAIVFTVASCSWLPTESLTSDHRLNGAATLQAFSLPEGVLKQQVAEVLDSADRRRGLATRFDGGRSWVCKASDLPKEARALHLRLTDGSVRTVRFVGHDRVSDVALLAETSRSTARLPRPAWASPPSEGAWVTTLRDPDTIHAGVVSGRPRSIAKYRPMLGIVLKDSDGAPGAVIEEVIKQGAAEQARLQPGDRILSFNGRPISHYRELQEAVWALQPGVHVAVDFVREGRRQQKAFTLGDETMNEGDNRNLKMSGPVSNRRSGFEEVFQHDCPLLPSSMGGPVVNLQGQLIGVNIARNDRVTTYALTQRAVRRAVARILRQSESSF